MDIREALEYPLPALSVSVNEITIETKNEQVFLIKNVGVGAGYIVASSHSIVDAIPKENYFAMVESAVEYGSF